MTENANHPSFSADDQKLLFECQLEIETSWMSGDGPKAVHRLAREHPALAKALYEFFAFIIETPVGPSRRGSTVDASETSRPFLGLLKDVKGERLPGIAASMEIPQDFLVVVSKYGAVLPRKAREELVRRARLTRDIDETTALASFDAPTHLQRAASRSGPYEPLDVTYETVVIRSTLSVEEKRFWLGLA
jgi:hypothetical protein